MPRVFISHSTKDREFVEREIIDSLHRHGIHTWYSPDDIRTAEQWANSIVDGLEQCDWFLVVMSRHAQQSDWVKSEVSWAIHYRDGRIIPVLIEECETYKIHLKLFTIQHLDFRSNPVLARAKLVKFFAAEATQPATTGPAGTPTVESKPPPGQSPPSRVDAEPDVRRQSASTPLRPSGSDITTAEPNGSGIDLFRPSDSRINPQRFDGSGQADIDQTVVLPMDTPTRVAEFAYVPPMARPPAQAHTAPTRATPVPVPLAASPRSQRPVTKGGFLERLFGRSATGACWGLDIGQAALKAIKLVPDENSDQVVAEAFDFIEYPKILSQPDADPDELMREALATFTDRNILKRCKIAIAVPGQSGLVKFIKLPTVEKKRIPDIVKFEAKWQIPFALDEVVWAYQQIGDDEEEFTMAEVGLFAMKRDQISRAILPLTVAGIKVDLVQMSPIALHNYISFDHIKGSGSKDSVVLLDIGADNTDLIITDGDRIWQRNVPIGGNHLTRALTKELKLTFAKAEHLKRNAARAPDPRAIFTAMRGVFHDFASEVNRSIGFYSSINRTAKIRNVVGLGNGFKLPGLQKFLQENLKLEIERLKTFEKLIGDEVKGAPQFQDNLASFAVAYGLGIQGLGKGRLSTNLWPTK
jgi:type IV pilus assembly protein PilM